MLSDRATYETVSIAVAPRDDIEKAVCAYDRILWPLSCKSKRMGFFHKFHLSKLIHGQVRVALASLEQDLLNDIRGIN